MTIKTVLCAIDINRPEAEAIVLRRAHKIAEAEGLERILVAGGVAANARLRLELCQRAAESNQRAFFPPPEHCTDNAVMIAGLGHHLLAADRLAGLELDVRPN